MGRSRLHALALAAACFLFAAPAARTAPAVGPQPVVTFRLQSPQDGAFVSPGQLVVLRLKVFVSGDNAGLALGLVDLVQDPTNPELFDLPPGRAPAAMAEFDRPLGFANPDPADPWGSGYGGVQVGPAGARDLVQIGGAQNTFGFAPPCVGPAADVCQGQGTVVRSGVGQGPNGQLLAVVRFPAPATPGTYGFRIDGAVATVLDQVVAGGASTVRHARAQMNFDTVGFTVQ